MRTNMNTRVSLIVHLATGLFLGHLLLAVVTGLRTIALFLDADRAQPTAGT